MPILTHLIAAMGGCVLGVLATLVLQFFAGGQALDEEMR